MNTDKYEVRKNFFVIFACFVVTALLKPSAQQPAFRSSVTTVAVYARVTDRNGRLVTNLSKTDFQVLDNGNPVEIALFSNEPQPAVAVVLLDMSDSMVSRVMRVREAARTFVDAVRPGDRVRIGTFGDEIAVSPDATDSRATLTRILQEELWPGGATPLWNALHEAMAAQDKETGRRVVLVLTDGEDSASLPGFSGTLERVERKAIDEDFMVYAIGIESRLDRRLVALAEQTGGASFDLKRDADLPATFARVAEELRAQYLIGFKPGALDDKLHKVELRTSQRGLEVRARKSYLAAAR